MGADDIFVIHLNRIHQCQGGAMGNPGLTRSPRGGAMKILIQAGIPFVGDCVADVPTEASEYSAPATASVK